MGKLERGVRQDNSGYGASEMCGVAEWCVSSKQPDYVKGSEGETPLPELKFNTGEKYHGYVSMWFEVS